MSIKPFECPICSNEFSKDKYIPKLLKCGDTICIICINDIYEKFKFCPICRIDINEDIENLRTNHYAYGVDNKIICDICLEDFDSSFNTEKVPKVLKCGDTLCLDCIINLYNNKTKNNNNINNINIINNINNTPSNNIDIIDEINCPICTKKCKEKLEDIPVNKLAIELLENELMNNMKILTSKEEKDVPETHDYQFSVGLMGDSGVGKTCISYYFYKGEPLKNTISTQGLEFHYKLLKIKDMLIKIRLFDTSGQEVYRSIAIGMLRGVDGIAIVFSLSIAFSKFFEEWKNAKKNRKIELEEEYIKETFNKVKDWYNQYCQVVNINEKVVYLIGNKVDDKKNRVIDKEVALDFANKLNAKYFETSAISGENINSTFKRFFLDLLLKNKKNEKDEKNLLKINDSFNLRSTRRKRRKKCC
jgi:GTPase SAR1 family protein